MIDHRVAQDQMADLDEAVGVVRDEQVDVAEQAQRVVRGKTGKRHYVTSNVTGGRRRLDDIRRAARAADGEQQVAGLGVEPDLAGEHFREIMVVAEAGQRRRVVEGQRPDAAVLAEVDRHVAGYRGAAAVADEHRLAAGVVDAARGQRRGSYRGPGGEGVSAPSVAWTLSSAEPRVFR